jgi:hypothetical protein
MISRPLPSIAAESLQVTAVVGDELKVLCENSILKKERYPTSVYDCWKPSKVAKGAVHCSIKISETWSLTLKSRLLGQVKEKRSAEYALQWASEHGVEGELGGKLGLLKMVLRGIMMAGAKSFTHMLIALERSDDLLTQLVTETGQEVHPPPLPPTHHNH